MPIQAQIIADSVNPLGCRLTTFVLEYPRFVHAELMTHRMFSKNAASSRAIPIEKMIEAVQTNPAMPVWWGKNQSGMQAKEELDDHVKRHSHYYNTTPQSFNDGHEILSDLEMAKKRWLIARDLAITQVRHLNDLGLHKQIANRILEPWFHIKIILSGTEFENFFALRAHPDAQPEIQALAYLMLERYNESKPKPLAVGEWHVPFGDGIDEIQNVNRLEATLTEMGLWSEDYIEQEGIWQEAKRKIAIARCARISYLNYEGKDDYSADIKLCDRLFGANPKHLSPTEHVARCEANDAFSGNFRGWTQYRKTFADESLSDPRVLK